MAIKDDPWDMLVRELRKRLEAAYRWELPAYQRPSDFFWLATDECSVFFARTHIVTAEIGRNWGQTDWDLNFEGMLDTMGVRVVLDDGRTFEYTFRQLGRESFDAFVHWLDLGHEDY